MRAEENWDENKLHGGHLVAFADDGHVLTTLGVAVKLAEFLPDIYAEDRLDVVVPEAQWPEGWKKQTEGGILLGAPIDTDDYVRAYLQEKIEKNKPAPINALNCLNKRLALHLTTFWYNVEPDYMFRTVPSHLTGSAATQHDQYHGSYWRV